VPLGPVFELSDHGCIDLSSPRDFGHERFPMPPMMVTV
jgi:hypothetical protein